MVVEVFELESITKGRTRNGSDLEKSGGRGGNKNSWIDTCKKNKK